MLPEKFVVKIQNHELASELKKFKFGPYKSTPFSPFVYWDKEYAGECLKSEINNKLRKGVESWLVYTYQEWKELYYKKDFVLPEKWCVKATPCKTVQKFFTTYKNNNIKDFETSDYSNWFFCSETVDGDWQYVSNYIYEDFSEITFEQFKEYVMEQKMYTIEELNEYKANNSIVVHVKNKEEWKKLKQICPNIANYNETKAYYLASTEGYNNTPYYKTIEFEQIAFNKTYTVEECREKNIAVYFKTLEEANMLARESGYTKHWSLQNLNKINCIRFPKNSVCPSWERDNGKYFRNEHNITQFINFEQVKFKQTMENKFGIKVENDNARDIVEFLTSQGVKHDWIGTGSSTSIYYVENNKMKECTSRILEGFTVYTLEEYKKTLGRKIMGYKVPSDLFGGHVAKGDIYKISNISADKIAYGFDANPAFNMPKEIVEKWQPVFEELIKSKEISLGTPARKFTIFKDKVDVISGSGEKYTFTNEDVKNIDLKFATFVFKGLNCDVTELNIGCAEGLKVTKETIDTIKEIQSTL